LSERFEREVGEGGAAPERERVAELRRGGAGVARFECLPSLGPQALEPVQVELVRSELERVAGRTRDEHFVCGGSKQFSQARDVDL
jgi:hypothetical protein